MSFANIVKQIRFEMGLSMAELGAILGVNAAAVCKWENGGAIPRMNHMSKVAKLAKENNIKARFEDVFG
jgi:transcriptional regulator with XRE-family HTH domain